ncbi:MAG: phosphoglycerate dehydrogenase [Coxiellaceae bacterium]|nr:phosphoglycerate dehydrogenase [Coxiellaceae bacterium]
MYQILKLNNIAEVGLTQLESTQFHVGEEVKKPDAVVLRSYKMHDMEVPASVNVIARAGAGVNNIPIEKMTELGIPVLNTPGANANAVKELVLTGMFLACRHICQAWDFANQLKPDNNEQLNKTVEASKKQFAGFELPGRTLGLIGLGNIGVKVANAALALGMNVIGFDPSISVKHAWQMSSDVEQAENIDEVIKRSDFISVHVPLNDHTRGMINEINIASMKDGVVLLNFARDGIIDMNGLVKALESGKVASYVTDFPNMALKPFKQVICLPHLGASTKEAEENCAVMAMKQIRRFLEEGTIKNSVNFPNVSLPMTEHPRISIVNRNVPNMVAQITTTLSDADINIIDLLNKSRGDIAYNLLDINIMPSDEVMTKLEQIDGVIKVRKIGSPNPLL